MSEGTKALRSYAVVTAAYWAFTLTDGALRMVVLGHFHLLGYTPFQLASLFLLYEFCGVVTNLLGGWLGAKTGLRFTLLLGLVLQVLALLSLSGLSPAWSTSWQVAYVVAAQGLSGIAKDFTKMSAKSAIKVLVPNDASGTLFRWVALLTGSKNTLKGLGFFLGGALLATLGFRHSLWAMAGALAFAITLVLATLPSTMGKSKAVLRDALRSSRAIKILSMARLFLFCARDVWFVVGLPVFLADILGWSFFRIGSYLALWVVGYGVVQAVTPRLMRNTGRGTSNDARAAQLWAALLALIPLAIFLGLRTNLPDQPVVLGGLALFGVVFAINSAVHSYLVLAYSESHRVSLNVGFYYMANAMGRLLGTLLSGLLYQAAGLSGCLIAASVMVAASGITALALPDTRSHS